MPEAGEGDIPQPCGMDPRASPEAPGRVVMLNQLLRRLGDIARQGDPVEMGDEEPASGNKQTANLLRRARPVEPVPALPRGDPIEALSGKAGLLGRCQPELHGETFAGRQPPGLLQEGRGDIDPGDQAAPGGEASRHGARAGAEIHNALPR